MRLGHWGVEITNYMLNQTSCNLSGIDDGPSRSLDFFDFNSGIKLSHLENFQLSAFFFSLSLETAFDSTTAEFPLNHDDEIQSVCVNLAAVKVMHLCGNTENILRPFQTSSILQGTETHHLDDKTLILYNTHKKKINS